MNEIRKLINRIINDNGDGITYKFPNLSNWLFELHHFITIRVSPNMDRREHCLL